jgi:hypothetical protein
MICHGYYLFVFHSNWICVKIFFFIHISEEFSVLAKANATNVAYTQGYLQLHTDLPYYEYKPGVNSQLIFEFSN